MLDVTENIKDFTLRYGVWLQLWGQPFYQFFVLDSLRVKVFKGKLSGYKSELNYKPDAQTSFL